MFGRCFEENSAVVERVFVGTLTVHFRWKRFPKELELGLARCALAPLR